MKRSKGKWAALAIGGTIAILTAAWVVDKTLETRRDNESRTKAPNRALRVGGAGD